MGAAYVDPDGRHVVHLQVVLLLQVYLQLLNTLMRLHSMAQLCLSSAGLDEQTWALGCMLHLGAVGIRAAGRQRQGGHLQVLSSCMPRAHSCRHSSLQINAQMALIPV